MSASSRQQPLLEIGSKATQPGGIMRRLGRDQSGTVAMMFGLLVIPLTAFVGLAVDFGRVYKAASHTQSALDAAALAAGRVAQVEKTDMISKASAAASAFFDHAKPTDVVTSSLTFSPNALGTQFTVSATTWVRTPFLGALKYIASREEDTAAPDSCKGNAFGCMKVTNSSTAELQVGGNGAESLEIAMMLDITGSMSGQKLSDLQSAARDLIDIVVWDDQSTYTSKVALAPFSVAVNAGSYFTAVTGLSDDVDANGDGYRDDLPATCYNSRGQIKSSCKTTANKVKTYSTCVVERATSAFNDDAPGGTKYLTSFDVATGDSLTSGNGNANCLPSKATIMPLTKDKQALKDMITNNFVANGNTAGHLGTAWAWYLLSPKWGAIWPAASAPSAYGTPNLKKIAVLMTDGEYNQQYLLAQNGDSTSQARTLCTNMKANGVGIEVYTVGFQLGNNATAVTTLQKCATDASHFYNTSTGDELRAAFRDIALKVTNLRLTN
jgi:Flp pilus assembly protein TadG